MVTDRQPCFVLSCFGVVEDCSLFLWPVGVFLGVGEGFIRLVRFIASEVTQIGKYTGIWFYLGTGLF